MKNRQLCELELDQVHDNPLQPRFTISNELKTSVKAAVEDNGGRYPESMAIQVRERKEGGYEILAGHHRAGAARDLGLGTIWAFVCELSDEEAAALLATSNIQRGMTTLEHGKHAIFMQDEHGWTFAQYARAIGKSENSVYTYVHAYRVLEQFGGIKGQFAKVPTQALAALHGIGDRALQSSLLLQFHRRNTPGPMAVEVLRLMRENGLPMFLALEAAEGKDLVEPTAAGGSPRVDAHARPQGGQPSLSGKNPVASAADSNALLLSHLSDETIAGYEWTLALYQARAEEMEKVLAGKLSNQERAQLDDAIARLHKKIVGELQAERNATRPKKKSPAEAST